MKGNAARLAALLFSVVCMAAVSYSPVVQVVPGPAMPPEVQCMGSNNNLDVAQFNGRTFLAFRTAPTHFASKKTRLYIVSSKDRQAWDYETQVYIGADMREPRFLVVDDKLMFYFFEAGQNPLAFSPKHIWAMERKAPGQWTDPTPVFQTGCVLWRAKQRNDQVYITAYCGGDQMYKGGNEGVGIYFLTTTDGYDFQPLNPDRAVVSTGGSETAFEFDAQGNLYLAIRNEAGDGESWGSKVCKATPENLTDWKCEVTPFKYDSPLMFNHNDDIYLIARRNLDGEYDKGQRWMWDPAESLYYMARYWWTIKRTALYKLDKQNLVFEPLLDFPTTGDTAFPGLIKLDENSYLMFNYSSPPDGPDRFWMSGQLTGSQIYSTVITFEQ